MVLKAMESKGIVREISKKNEPQWLFDRRIAAYEIFKEKPMPSFIYGLNINLNIDLDLEKLKIESSRISREIINKNKEAIITDFNQALKSKESILKERFMSAVKATDKFTSFHHAFVDSLIFIHIPKNAQIEKPIEIISRINSEIAFDHLIIVAEDNSSVDIVEDFSSGNGNSYVSKIVEIFAGNNAKVNYGNLQLLDKKSFQFVKKRAVAGKNSTINWLDCCFGSEITLSEVTTYLDGEGAETNNHGIFFGNKKQQFDLVANSIHNAQKTVSDIFTKGALTDKSKCVYRGLVKIQRNAGGSNGYQKEDTLLLSPDAAADSIPDLEIDNSDVRCTHGASIGRIDREKMFYLKSRGMDDKEATSLYVKGFFEELIQKMKMPKLRDNMHGLIEERMG